MILTYTRTANGEHGWKDENGEPALWRGHSCWYYHRPSAAYIARRLCAGDWTDGEAIQMYRAMCRAELIRVRIAQDEIDELGFC